MTFELTATSRKRRMQRLLSVALFVVLTIHLTANSYDSTLETSDDAQHPITTTPCRQSDTFGSEQLMRSPSGASVKHPAENGSNELLIQTSSGLRRVVLQGYKVKVELPYTAYYAHLRVRSTYDVITMNKSPTRALNYSLGLGANYLDVGYSSGGDSRREGHHLITLHRRDREAVTINSSRRELCYLEQDCDLIVYDGRKCGLQPLRLLNNISANHQGYWKLNCQSCELESTCQWSQAHWIESDEIQQIRTPLTDSQINSCLQNRQLLFLGDSTNRAMMQTLMERVNSTLHHAVKSHHFINYDSVGKSANFSFMYFPIFWQKNHPTFIQTLYSLANESLRDEGIQRKTILVIGGVQWLSKSQLTEIHKFVRGRGIPASNVYIKTHSSGFHLAVPGLAFLHTKDSIRMLIRENEELRRLALSYGFKVIDTLKMTLSRYKDFLPGKCACHFHQVNEYYGKSQPLPSNNSYSQQNASIVSKLYKLGLVEKTTPKVYHISGQIHSAYTANLIRQMCERV